MFKGLESIKKTSIELKHIKDTEGVDANIDRFAKLVFNVAIVMFANTVLVVCLAAFTSMILRSLEVEITSILVANLLGVFGLIYAALIVLTLITIFIVINKEELYQYKNKVKSKCNNK